MKRLGPWLAIVLFFAGFAIGRTMPPRTDTISPRPAPTTIKTETHTVSRVIDGDTIVLTSGDHVRYMGIDSPETGARWSSQATQKNSELVANKTVRLEFDQKTHDTYGRLLAYVWVGDTMVNEALVRSGYARFYPIKGETTLKYKDLLLAAESDAKQAHLGIWMDEWEKTNN